MSTVCYHSAKVIGGDASLAGLFRSVVNVNQSYIEGSHHVRGIESASFVRAQSSCAVDSGRVSNPALPTNFAVL